MTLHPTAPNPYTLLGILPPRIKVYTCLDLQDAFFCICPAPPQRHSPSLPLNGKIQSGHQTTAHLDPLGFKGLRTPQPKKKKTTPQPSLGKPWLLTWTHSIQESMDVGSYSTWMTCCWLPRPRKNAGKGQRHCSSC